MPDPDMLEHADRNDTVEAALDVTVIRKLERDAGQGLFGQLPFGIAKLLARKRDADDAGTGDFV